MLPFTKKQSAPETDEEDILEEKKAGITSQPIFQALLRAFDKVAAIQAQSAVLVLGNTGSGKSTLINYLLSCEMEEKVDERTGDDYISTVSKAYAEIGHLHDSAASKTEGLAFYSNAVTDTWGYCDSPGFMDNRHLEARVVGAFGQHLVTQQAAQIQGIVLVIPVPALTEQRGENIRTLLAIMSRFLKDPLSCQESLVFVFTKVGKKKKSHILYLLRQLEKAVSAIESSVERNTMLALLQCMCGHPDRMILFQPLDQGKSRLEIQQCLTEAKVIPRSQFLFASDTETASTLQTTFRAVILEGMQYMETVRESRPQRLTLESELKKQTEQNRTAQTELKDLQEEKKTESYETLLQRLQSSQEAAQRKIIVNLQQEQELLEAYTSEINRLKSDTTPVKYKEEKFFNPGSRKKRGEGYKYFYYQGPPIAEVKMSCHPADYFMNEKRSQNAYSVTYCYVFNRKAHANVRIYIQNKHHPDTKTELQAFKEKMASCKTRIAQLQWELERSKNPEQTVEKILLATSLEHLAEQNKDRERLKKKLQEEVSHTQAEITRLKQAIQRIERRYQAAKGQLEGQHAVWKKLARIAAVVVFEGNLAADMQQFLLVWRNYQAGLPTLSTGSSHFFSSGRALTAGDEKPQERAHAASKKSAKTKEFTPKT